MGQVRLSVLPKGAQDHLPHPTSFCVLADFVRTGLSTEIDKVLMHVLITLVFCGSSFALMQSHSPNLRGYLIIDAFTDVAM